MRLEPVNANRATLALFAIGAGWPSIYGALTEAMRSPLEQALYASWCGAAPHGVDAFLGHCAACWVGACAFMAAGALVALSRRRFPQAAI